MWVNQVTSEFSKYFSTARRLLKALLRPAWVKVVIGLATAVVGWVYCCAAYADKDDELAALSISPATIWVAVVLVVIMTRLVAYYWRLCG